MKIEEKDALIEILLFLVNSFPFKFLCGLLIAMFIMWVQEKLQKAK